VVWGGKTNKKAVEKAKAELDKYNIRILGVVINNLNIKKTRGYGYYQYHYNYQYKYQEKYKTKEYTAAKQNRKKEIGSRNFRK
jgi:Mrp family chromosome partitioning ATPase